MVMEMLSVQMQQSSRIPSSLDVNAKNCRDYSSEEWEGQPGASSLLQELPDDTSLCSFEALQETEKHAERLNSRV